MAITNPSQLWYTATGSGASKRTIVSKFTDMVSVRDFGAVGDGSADDTAAFSNAIASLTGGGTVRIPVGVYKLTSTLSTSITGITLEGEGYGSKLYITHTSDALLVSGQLFRLRNMEIQINTTANRTGAAVLHFQAGQGHVSAIRVTGNNSSPNNGIGFLQDVDASDNWEYSGVRFPGGATWTSAWRATAVTGTVATTQISNSTFVNGTTTNAVIDIDGAIDTFLVTNCDFPTYGGRSIWIRNTVGAATGFPRYVHFNNVSIEGGGGGGAPTTAIDVATVFDFQFEGGYVASAITGLAIGAGVQYMKIIGNHFVSFTQRAITVDAAAQGVVIDANTFMDASSSSSGTYEDILINAGALGLNISNNFFNTSAATKPKYHINLAAGATDQYVIIGNRQGPGSTTTSFMNNGATGSTRTLAGNPGVTNTFSGDQTTFNTQVNVNSPAKIEARGGVENDSGDLVLTSSTRFTSLQAFYATRVAPTYGASVAIDASLGSVFTITATNGTAFTVANPTNPKNGGVITVVIRNTSGGALGVVTWDTLYKLAAWSSPANTNSRSVQFVYDGTNWIEIARTPNDVPN